MRSMNISEERHCREATKGRDNGAGLESQSQTHVIATHAVEVEECDAPKSYGILYFDVTAV